LRFDLNYFEDKMSVAVSIAMCVTYGLFAFGKLGDSHDKFCLANEVKYFPHNYTD